MMHVITMIANITAITTARLVTTVPTILVSFLPESAQHMS